MHCSRPTSWILALVYGALVAVGCTATTDTSEGETGSLTLNLEVGSVEIDAVDYLITGDGTAEGGTIDTSAPGSTASVEVFGLLPGKYTVTMSATATDGETMCKGSEDFLINADKLTEIMVYLRCKLPETLGGVRVNGEFNVCAVVNESVVKPLQTSVGNDIDLSAMGEDAEGDDITYLWTGTGGDIDDPSAKATTYTCEEVGKHSVTITVSDDGFDYCMDSWTTAVTCVEGDGPECTDDEDCGLDEICVDFECVPDLECTDDEDCDEGKVCNDNNECVPDVECDENEDCDTGEICLDNKCVPDVECNDDQDCDTGFVCENFECVPDVECNENDDCDLGDICLDNVCRADPDLFCDTGLCVEDTVLRAECVDKFLLCLADNVDEEECVVLSIALCTGCTEAADCQEDGNECTDAVCDAGTCGTSNNTEVCDGGAGTCSAGVCVPDAECSVDGDCPDDGNECTDAVCDAGACGTSNNDTNTCDTCGGSSCACSGGTCISDCTVPAPVDATGIPMACRNSFNQAVSTFPIDLLNVTPDDCIEAGQPFNTAIDPTIALDTAFLEAAAQTLCDLGTFLTEADVTTAQVSVDAIAGATCTEQLSVLPGVPLTVTLDISIVGSCGSGGVVSVDSGITVPLPPMNVPCSAAGAAGSEVQFCSTGQVPLEISLTDPAPPPAYSETYVGVSVGGGAITVSFACNTSSTTVPAPGQENDIGCVLTNPTASTPNGLSCADEVGLGNVGETPFPTSDCNTADGPPIPNQTCDLFGNQTPCSGTCETVPVAVDPSTVCATFTVQ